jgi:hypothetical protein
MQVMILMVATQARKVSMSMAHSRLRLCARGMNQQAAQVTVAPLADA